MFIIKDTQKAINTMVSIILLTCPCGIGTGLPILFSKYVSNLLSKDVYIKNLNIVDNISNINAIIFDKTGTLTNTNFIFSNFKNINEYNDIIYTMQYYSNHPLSFQIINHLEKSSILDIQNFEEKNKYGITANINNTKYYMGNHLYVNEVLNIKINPSYIVLFDNNQVLAYFKISNTMINNSSETITLLKKQFKIGILSGDIKENVSKVANKLGINNFQYSKSNIEKKEIIDKLSKTNHVMYVGDGLNDTLAANSSDISVSFKHGNEINTSYSDIVLLNHDLNLINETINYTKFTQTILNTIIIFTLLYNFIFIILASLNLISMGLAPLGEVFTTLIIIIFIVIITIKNK